MSGTRTGGLKARDVILAKRGKGYYRQLGALGGRVRGPKGFASPKVGRDGLTGRQRARIVGVNGGRVSKRHGTCIQGLADCFCNID